MGQANKTCPVCDRVPGTQHTSECPRSKQSVASLDARAKIAGRPTKVYPGKGDLIATFEDAEGKRHFLKNRGLPFVNVPKHGKSPFAGGIPRDDDGSRLTPKDLMDEVEFFNAGLAAQEARVKAAEAARKDSEEAGLSSDEGTEAYSQELLDEASELNLPPYVLAAARSTAVDRKENFQLIREGRVIVFDPEGNATVATPDPAE